MNSRISVVTLVAVIMTTGCAGNPNSSLANQCESGLKQGYKELDYTRASGIRSSIELTKAASLLVAASTQAEFGKYPNCIEKVKRARGYIRHSSK
ncbi:MAG TPA: hypothetical protein ENI65_12070 [Gammaproteobacteria bacterium]|nr:hypothetical protein [Gammaproteobacteria bacterium]